MSLFDGFSEKELEMMIVNNLSDMPSRGLDEFYEHTANQFQLPLGGVADIVTWQVQDKTVYIRVIELKKEEISVSTLLQALSYHQCLGFVDVVFENVDVEVILIGKTVKDDLSLIVDFKIPKLRVYKYDYNYNGLFFTRVTEEVNEKANSEQLKVQFGNSYEPFINFSKRLLGNHLCASYS